jgi:glycosyltransferase involved in cell wall biosynthesis
MDLSVVMPVYNEEESVRFTIEEIVDVLKKLNLEWELIAVNDGSSDASAAILADINSSIPNVKVISLRDNFGQTAAMSAGIVATSGRCILTIDADGQNDPGEIPRLLDAINDGSDFVAGWRKSRQDSVSRRVPSKIANWLISKATGIDLHDFGCSLKAFRSEIIKDVLLIGEMHRMIPVFVKRNGGSIQELIVNHRPRTAGSSKYGLSRTPKVIADLVVARFLMASTSNPMYLFGKFSIFGILLATLTSGLSFYLKLSGQKDLVETPLPLIAAFSLMFASLAFLLGLLAEVLVRVHFQQVGPPYRVRWTKGF